MSFLNDALLELFQAHSVAASLKGGWVILTDTGMRSRVDVGREIKLPQMTTVQLDVLLEISPRQTLVESFAGIGATAQEASVEALGVFCANVFHIWLAAFFESSEHAASEEWRIGGRLRKATFGSFFIRGKLPAEGVPLERSIEYLQKKMALLPLGAEAHWVRLYYQRQGTKPPVCEILLDNRPWNSMQSEIQSLAWPFSEDFYSARFFLVIHPEEKPISK